MHRLRAIGETRVYAKTSNPGRAVFVSCPQARTASSENAFGYDGGASGQTIYSYVNGNPVSLFDDDGLSPRGERGQTGSASGTNSPFKKLRPDPNKPGSVLDKDNQTGKEVSKKPPPGFEEWWNKKHPNKPFQGGFSTPQMCIRMGVGVLLLLVPGNIGQCSDPCKCGDLCQQ
ncbi:MAG: hypothetical protein IPL03_08525 [Sterolibacteriaceae bacterium]|nr:hypothetical protein [Candidatus Methylophosphatis haderslevensis]